MVYGSVIDEFGDSWNPISKPNSPLIFGIQQMLWPFLRFLPILPKCGCHGNVPCIRNVLFGLANDENSLRSKHILVVSHRNVFTAFFVPKLVTMVMPLCLLYMGVSWMNSLIAETLSENQTLHWYVTYNRSYGHFCAVRFLPILAKIWLPWQRPLHTDSQECLLWLADQETPL